jgi:hypothetical protein
VEQPRTVSASAVSRKRPLLDAEDAAMPAPGVRALYVPSPAKSFTPVRRAKSQHALSSVAAHAAASAGAVFQRSDEADGLPKSGSNPSLLISHQLSPQKASLALPSATNGAPAVRRSREPSSGGLSDRTNVRATPSPAPVLEAERHAASAALAKPLPAAAHQPQGAQSDVMRRLQAMRQNKEKRQQQQQLAQRPTVAP